MDAQQQLDLMLRHQGMATICESEDALGSSESEPARPARPRGKRSRAAEVHNLSEKRRRSRINEKMKALQTLIPNSSKTDKASMLDDAIEYLKQLQLQVQMLSMRNGLYLPPASLSGAPEALAPLEMCATLNQTGVKPSDSGVVQPMSQISLAHHSFDPPNHDQQHNKPLVLQSVPTSSTTTEPRFLQEPAQPDLQSFQLALPPEMIFKEDMLLKYASVQGTTSLPGHEVKPARQETCMLNSERFDRGSLRKEVTQDMMPKNTESLLFMPYLHSGEGGLSMLDSDWFGIISSSSFATRSYTTHEKSMKSLFEELLGAYATVSDFDAACKAMVLREVRGQNQASCMVYRSS